MPHGTDLVNFSGHRWLAPITARLVDLAGQLIWNTPIGTPTAPTPGGEGR